ncbi:hypothetical protein PAHAL_5G320300 [Panicum hallii]|jgi:hypothetical protein|uniref:DUF4283 domain-containing protein n=1 Tax=Panicum hallii TaxID=206008 RepID=A0A2T8ILW3_9POAL|nr:hypothetical protein PAHAL_5G320300 [Panicum hallii]
MNMYGFGFPGQGFHCLKIPGFAKKQNADHVGLIKIMSGEANVDRMDQELKNLIDEKWNWKVRKISESDYLAIFPNIMILDTFSRSKGFELALFNISESVSHSDLDPFASAVLQTRWVQLSNIPDMAKNTDAVTLIGELAGEVIAVDEVSLIKEGPVRVKLRARGMEKLKRLCGSIHRRDWI